MVVTHNLYPPNELEREKARTVASPLRPLDEPDRPARIAPRPEPTLLGRESPRSGPTSTRSARPSAILSDEVRN